jgi:hypothetical protein
MPVDVNNCPAEFRPPDMKLGYELSMIVLPSGLNCTKPFVVCRFLIYVF